MSEAKISPTEEIIADIAAGRMVILMDDEGRENEGDLIMAAEFVTADAINFMVREARGLVCLPLTRERCQQLRLPQMVSHNTTHLGTAFTVSIEAARGVTTGISAADRATTILAAIADDAGPEDIVTPGHIFPLAAEPGGVLVRAGHTEAAVDLATLAGCKPAGVICEILNENGEMARLPDLLPYAAQHGLKIGTIADLIRYRLEREHIVQREASGPWSSPYGQFTLHLYRDRIRRETHFALVHGDLAQSPGPVLVRVQVGKTLTDLFTGSEGPVARAMERLAREPAGVLVYLDHREDGDELKAQVEALPSHPKGPGQAGDSGRILRTFGLGAQILGDLGVHRAVVLSDSQFQYRGIGGFGLEIVGQLPFLEQGTAHD
ncbi:MULTISPECIES: 3,4-dihydroxy-2-butanone-4-phosphate synthase [Acidithiobacillus]|jgi:3,4-dihydroxy 2-butanone 4-phosphate synthase/GTP cyclohydrolase II|uniref:3,4-dihydroxy-2-butanone 4-phosphate synthase n=3 Tax=Acidithiobacillus caldus TaxID=33059 RepID=F9ZMB9_ACICS|nr:MULTISPECIES: 3,4-dihydroxy-2-butanone-4-phosphate synthase [Acidithiobacillus]AEK57233.1 3,4-dihydroxy-2-butanone 4-phosphate synthase / GTP cyclohydrolase II [Acidithiobacillus caldus SM-1]AIA54477.1 3,4-dihydroxy-2-butanone 4-phosphate synthase / GTP cyclohydrolase II [Acidithiobacillus caldus ATCC 51756]AUW31988.1 3,4-dihydroxy-2-butanone-4-phosphate synthase [Acidithiobacillus caldus]MBU2728408.1 3,4-dihydroxy-2-butanone-4-phosphate synthase [Acidithiobacillus caldus]MBU2734846.1 3,4-d